MRSVENRLRFAIVLGALSAITLLLPLSLCGATVTFDTLPPGPPYFLAPQIITIGTARFSGGQIGFGIGDSISNAYGATGSGGIFDHFSRTITIDFSTPVRNIQLLLENLQTFFLDNGASFSISDDNGHLVNVRLAAFDGFRQSIPNQRAQFISFPYSNIHQLRISNVTLGNQFSFQIDNVSYSTGPPEIVAVGLGEGPSLSTTPTSNLDSNAETSASVPYGSPFFMEIRRLQADGTYKAVPATFQVASSQPQFVGQKLGHWKTAFTLYPSTTFFTFSPNVAGLSKVFMPVHLGAGWVTIQPTDRPDQPIAVHVTVTQPASLGPAGLLDIGVTNNLTYDAQILHLAHDRGLPPQYLKAQIEQETFDRKSNYFNPFMWRYEPLGVDWGDPYGANGPPHSVSFGNRASAASDDKPNLEQVNYPPHSGYRIPDGSGLCPGPIGAPRSPTCPSDLDDIAPRYVVQPPFNVCRNGVLRPIQPGDDTVTIREIIYYNDPVFHLIS
jgi:hypothetical protein